MISEAGRKKVIIVDDHSIVRTGIAAVIAAEPDLMICAECENGEDALRATRQNQPDLAIVDLTLGKESALPLINRLLAIKPDLRILILSMHDESIYAMRTIKVGAHGYIMKGANTDALRTAVRTVLAGDIFVSNRMHSQVLRQMAGGPAQRPKSGIDGISQKELAVLQMIGSGMSLPEIASNLGRSLRTVEAHRNNIRLKLGLSSSTALVHYATQWVRSLD